MKPSDIRAFRKRYLFTRQELGDAVDMPAHTIANIEQSRTPLTVDRVRALKAFFSFVTKCAEYNRL